MNKDWLNVPGRGAPPRLLVAGDVMLDRCRSGHAERASAEAPALVLRLDREEARLGGAARVALYASRLGAEVALAGAVGVDDEAAEVRALLSGAGVNHEGVVTAPDRPTTLKERLLGLSSGPPAQLLRLDRETRGHLPPDSAALLSRHVERLLGWCDAVLVADHGKGVCSPGLLAELAAAGAKGTPVLADPAPGAPLCRYAGAAAVLPNRAEAEAILGRPVATPGDGIRAAAELAERAGTYAVLLKLDRDGLVLARRGPGPVRLKARAGRVWGVAGAGDMVLAAAGLCRAAWLPWHETARLANLAAGLMVERPEDVPVTREDLEAASWQDGVDRPEKLTTLGGLEALAEEHRKRGLRVVLTNGCFDLLHAGHLHLLEQAAKLGDVLVVAVNDDDSVRRLKGPGRPVVPAQDRAALLAALACVSHVLVFSGDTPHEVLKRVRPDVLVKGGDYREGEVVGREVVEGYGGRVVVAKRKDGASTTGLIRDVVKRAAG